MSYLSHGRQRRRNWRRSPYTLATVFVWGVLLAVVGTLLWQAMGL